MLYLRTEQQETTIWKLWFTIGQTIELLSYKSYKACKKLGAENKESKMQINRKIYYVHKLEEAAYWSHFLAKLTYAFNSATVKIR